MADIVLSQGESVPSTMQTRYRDMGDSTHALVVATGTAGAQDVTLQRVVNTCNAAGQNVIVPAPGAGQRIVVSQFSMQNESAVATTMILNAGGVNLWRNLAQNQGNGTSGALPVGREWPLPANTALGIWLSGANLCGYSIVYYVQAVS